ncbi:MAG: glycosyltransferase family 2 protein [Hyphomicrobiales bacterium]|nr:MAG: glycosyltransferase family 2 protein [Hyphomicrobiales bacterium]
MRVYVLIPVFNRLEHTQRVIAALRAQRLDGGVVIVVINDGSTDGTAEFLYAQPDVTTLTGDGNLWWGGAIDLGLQHVLPRAADDDYILFLNNDTWFAQDYVSQLVVASRTHGGAAVGSVIHEEDKTPPLVSIGPRININRLAVWDELSLVPEAEKSNPKEFYRVDALSGRGTLYPARLFKAHGSMRPRVLPHYLADYEIAMRFKRDAGIALVVSSRAIVFSPPVYGNDVSSMGLWDRLFGARSSSNVIRRLAFYSMVGSPIQRLTAPARMFYFSASRALREKLRQFAARNS